MTILNRQSPSKGRYKSTVHADGSITTGWVSGQKAVYVADERYEEALTLEPDTVTEVYMDGNLVQRDTKVTGLSAEQCEILGHSHWSLGSSVPAIPRNDNDNTRKRKGQQGISSHGRRTVRSGCTLLEEKYGKRGLAFLTLTAPVLSSDGKILFVSQWGLICKTFRDRVRRLAKRQAVHLDWVDVTELQPKRSARENWACLHLHAVFNSRLGDAYWLTADQVRQIWREVLDYYTGDETNTSAAVDIVTVKKSAANYLGKYISKGGDTIKQFEDTPWMDILPTKWWYVSSDLKKAVKATQTELPAEESEALACDGEALLEHEIVAYHYNICTTLKDGNTRVMGSVSQMYGSLRSGMSAFMDKLCKYIDWKNKTHDTQMVAT